MPLPAAGGHEGSQLVLGGLAKLWLGTDLQFWRSGAPLPSHFPCNLAKNLVALVVRGSTPRAT